MYKIKNKFSKLCPAIGELINKIIDNIPVDLTLPGYNFCGPGSNKKLNYASKNKLDSYCKKHDIFYANHLDTESRRVADLLLAKKAFGVSLAKDSSLKEKLVALLVAYIMELKSKFGKRNSLN